MPLSLVEAPLPKNLPTNQIICFPKDRAIYKIGAPKKDMEGVVQWPRWKRIKVKHYFKVIWAKIVRTSARETYILGGQNEESE